MEPLTILYIAAAAVRLLDYGAGVFVDARELLDSSSGRAHRNTELSNNCRVLTTLTGHVEDKLKETSLSTDTLRATIIDLCRKSNHAGGEVRELLAALKANNRASLSAVTEDRSTPIPSCGAWSDIKAEELKDRLLQLRSHIIITVLITLRKLAGNNRRTLLETTESQVEMMRRLDKGDETVQGFGDKLLQLIQGQTQESREQMQAIVNCLLHSDWKPDNNWLAQAQKTDDGVRKSRGSHAHKIMASLMYGTMRQREEFIPKACTNTFEWMFREPSQTEGSSPNSRPLFQQWLTSDSNHLFWVTGEPGAGKSTLMKFVAADHRFTSLLETWAGTSQLLLARHFAWHAGDKLQNSHQGLLRTILYQCLSTNPKLLAPVIFPARWSLMQVFSNSVVAFPPWEFDELLSGFRALVSHAGHEIAPSQPAYKLALMVDGLDELEVDPGNHQSFIDVLTEANRNPNVRICVSSRPWDVFRDALGQNITLELENFTFPDIQLYILAKFQASSRFLELKTMHPAETEKLFGTIAEKAQGVFLWVAIVVQNLMQDLQEGDSISKLQKTLDSFPNDIFDVYQAIWQGVSTEHRREGSQYFRIVKCYELNNLTPFALNIGMGDNEESDLDSDPSLANEDFLSDVVTSLGGLLNIRTRGLLEIRQMSGVKSSVVSYMHRTTREWVTTNWDLLHAVAPESEFDENIWVLRGETFRLSIGDYENSTAKAPDVFWQSIGFSDGVWRHIDCPGGLWARIRSSYKFWEHIRRMLQVSLRVGSDYGPGEGGASLVQILDKLDREVLRRTPVKEISREVFWSPPPPPTTLSSRDAIAAASDAEAESQFWEEWRPMSFVGFMAQIPVPQYIYTKVSRDPTVLQGVGNRIRILVNAIFGGFFLSPELFNLANADGRNDEMRQDVVKFLLNYTPVEEAQRALDLVRYHGGIADSFRSMDGRPRWSYLRAVEEMLATHVSQNSSRELEDMAGRALKRASFLNRLKRTIRT